MNFLGKMSLNGVARRLDGYKTVIGGVGMMLLGIVQLIGHYWPESQLPGRDPVEAMEMIGFGFAALGLGGKLEKIKEIKPCEK